MKISDIILKSTQHDVENASLELILKKTRENKYSTHYSNRHKKILLTAAVTVICAATISASVIMSGFRNAFDVELSSDGQINILEYASTNENISWHFNEVWFDEYNLFIGGYIEIIDSLPEIPDGYCYGIEGYYRIKGEDESYMLSGKAYPDGSVNVPFALRAGGVSDSKGSLWRAGFKDKKVKLDITIDLFHIRPETGGYNAFENMVEIGEWNFTVECQRQDSSDAVILNGPIENDEFGMRIENVYLSPFTLLITGEKLDLGLDSETYILWLKMSDGTYMFKQKGIFAAKGKNFISWRDDSDKESLFAVAFEEPIDPTAVESIILASVWATFPGDAESFLVSDNWDYYPSIEDEPGRLEGWKTIFEIPLK